MSISIANTLGVHKLWINSSFSVLQEECQNYIRVLLVGGNHLFTCGTNAFTPICTNRTVWLKDCVWWAQVWAQALRQLINRQSMLWLCPDHLHVGWRADVCCLLYMCSYREDEYLCYWFLTGESEKSLLKNNYISGKQTNKQNPSCNLCVSKDQK